MVLNRKNLIDIKANPTLEVPDEAIFDLPEKVLQFGTGVLLRGLPEYFIDKANKAGLFNGRVVIVKSTGKGGTNEFDSQDSLYTIGVRGVENGQKVAENIICSAVSRVLSAQSQWDEILHLAGSKELKVVISNTTEVGIQLVDDDVNASPPKSFPGKLLAVLHERYKIFNGDRNAGLIVVPTELITNNGEVLKEITLTLARQNQLDDSFIRWIDESNSFCNSLVDRIVPGKPDNDTLDSLEKQFGYQDELLILAEAYKLWAIEGDQKVKDILSFEQADSGVVIADDITKFKELKLRLLNGSHTLTCATAILAGFKTVYEAMEDPQFSEFITSLLEEDLSKSIPYSIDTKDAAQFSANVLDRFRNPFIKHQWIAISANYTLKLKMRVVPTVLRYFENFNSVPEHISFGFAAYLLFMRTTLNDGIYQGDFNGSQYQVEEEHAEYFAKLWSTNSGSPGKVAFAALSNEKLWDTNLALLPGFVESVENYIGVIEEFGVIEGIKKVTSKRIHCNETE